jgi:hypothetical protein
VTRTAWVREGVADALGPLRLYSLMARARMRAYEMLQGADLERIPVNVVFSDYLANPAFKVCATEEAWRVALSISEQQALAFTRRYSPASLPEAISAQ